MNNLSAYEFADALITTSDLDPVYTVLWNTGWPRDVMERYLIAYWCYYDMGTAAWVLSRTNFYAALETAAASKAYPRGRERRHYRGIASITSTSWIRGYGLEAMWKPLRKPSMTASEVATTVRSWPMFGPWIAFKAADMIERLGLASVDFSDAGKDFYESPYEGAVDLWDSHNPGLDPDREPGGVVNWAVSMLLDHPLLKSHRAPPRFERPLNLQEAETCLCKFHSYLSGHYHVGEDIEACRKALMRFQVKPAQALLAAGEKGRLW